jgi:hypothetical protein
MAEIAFWIFVGVAIGWITGYMFLHTLTTWMLRRSEARLEELVKAIEEVTANNIQARVEEENGVFYVYNTKDNTFLAQGRTLTELREKIEERWPNANVAVTEGDVAVLERLKTTITDVTA